MDEFRAGCCGRTEKRLCCAVRPALALDKQQAGRGKRVLPGVEQAQAASAPRCDHRRGCIISTERSVIQSFVVLNRN